MVCAKDPAETPVPEIVYPKFKVRSPSTSALSKILIVTGLYISPVANTAVGFNN